MKLYFHLHSVNKIKDLLQSWRLTDNITFDYLEEWEKNGRNMF